MPNTYNRFYTKTGHYNWLDSNDEQVRISFELRPDNPFNTNLVAFVVNDFPDDDDFDTVYDCAVELKSRIDHYLINTDKPKIAQLVDYLEKYLYDDKIAELEHKIEVHTGLIADFRKRLESVKWEKENAE